MQILDLKQMDMTKSRFYQEVIQEGRLQGLEQGLQRGQAQLILRQLDRRFALSASDRSLILGLSVPQLEELAEALLDFTDLSDLLDWLGQKEETIAELS